MASGSTSSPEYDVCLSYLGSDVKNYAEKLYLELRNLGIHVFIDRVRFQPAFFEPINRPMLYIPILSESFALIPGCIKKLRHIQDFGRREQQWIVPIFYEITPSQVQFLQGVESGIELGNEVLVLRLVGMDEVESIRFVLQEVSRILRRSTKHFVTDHFVGLDRIEAIMGLVNGDANDVRMVRIHGMGGIGKTTLASIIYNKISNQFGGCCFLENIADMASRRDGLSYLQRLLLEGILNRQNLAYNVSHQLQHSLRHKKVLIVLDDVDSAKQINELAGKPGWFGLGSRIIVTTREIAGLPKGEAVYDYEMNELDKHAAFLLFCKRAFLHDSPPDSLVSISHKVVEATGGLPLSIETIASYLFAKPDIVWEEVLDS